MPARGSRARLTLTCCSRRYDTCFLKWYSESESRVFQDVVTRVGLLMVSKNTCAGPAPQTITNVLHCLRNTAAVCKYGVLAPFYQNETNGVGLTGGIERARDRQAG